MIIQTKFAAGKEEYTKEDVKITTPFTTAIIDPDWPYTVAPGRANLADVEKPDAGRLSGYTRNRDVSQNQYAAAEPLSIDDLKLLPIGDVVGGYLFLWTVAPFLINGAALDVLNCWGFTPASMLTWAKYDLKNDHGYGGVGWWFLGNAEFCIVAKRDSVKGLPSIRTGKSSLIFEHTFVAGAENDDPAIIIPPLIVEPKTRHSAKPDNIHVLCEERFPGPYLEIFGRKPRPNWTVLGDQAPGDGKDIRESLAGIRGTP